MDQNDQSNFASDKVFDPSIQSEKIAFDGHELVECSSCRRSNPPNRLACLYCGTTLDVERLDLEAVKPNLRKPDPWEVGISLVSVPSSPNGLTDFSAASRILSLDADVLKEILKSPIPLPLCRLESEAEVSAIQKLLDGLGIESTPVTDRSLDARNPPVRLARIDFSDSELSLITFNSREHLTIKADEIVLLVEGSIAESKVEQTEKRKGGTSKLQGEIATIFDEPILDIYSSKNVIGYRVLMSGFDFSSLGKDKGLIAAENLKELVRSLSAVCTKSRTISGFRSLRGLLGHVWELEMRRETKGLQVTGFGKREIGSTISTNNLEQFTKFSRLQRLML